MLKQSADESPPTKQNTQQSSETLLLSLQALKGQKLLKHADCLGQDNILLAQSEEQEPDISTPATFLNTPFSISPLAISLSRPIFSPILFAPSLRINIRIDPKAQHNFLILGENLMKNQSEPQLAP